jgi:hypothetical protein
VKSNNPPKPAAPILTNTLLDRFNPTQRKALLVGLLAFFMLVGLSTLLLAYYIFEPNITALFASPTPTLTPTPTPQCVRPTLTLGKSTYPLDVISLTPQGTLPTQTGAAGTAWWVADTFSPFVFLFKPAIGSPDLSTSLTPGDPLVVQWADCGREVFVLTKIQSGNPDAQALLAQAGPGMAVIVQPDGTTPGYVINGQRPELVNPATPEPTVANAIMVDITFEGTGLSADQKTLQTSLTITNRGSQPITMTMDDLSLTADGEAPLSPLSVQPALPQEIQPGGSLSLTITFPNPGGNTAVLKVLDTTVDLYY